MDKFIKLDEGYKFGIGLFETIHVKNRKAIFLDKHLERLNSSLEFFSINKKISKEEVLNYLNENIFNRNIESETKKNEVINMINFVLKIMVSSENTVFELRNYTYNQKDYDKGFVLGISKILRSNTSPFVYHKTLNYGECIYEKRKALEDNKNDFIFLNSDNEICECTSSNIFFVKDNKIFTPKIECGLLNGTVRDFVIENFEVSQVIIAVEQLENFDECFLTNSLMGVMPVKSVGKIIFKKHNTANIVRDKYKASL
ncbi:aminotransferase class IV [Peptostreptococcus equinus]|uniref:Aminotransferase class IV n=1 Tax=Peptostreptococcus equinus TaxID=3003601 RepID=A0ABY7JQA6_9FIRM|nr:aminotransferase class IV [Peptostreptococcus sp. CBA3647]WAW14348.1 aminotransferase class IV [Peptostreptococcus sp. CBA3647]